MASLTSSSYLLSTCYLLGGQDTLVEQNWQKSLPLGSLHFGGKVYELIIYIYVYIYIYIINYIYSIDSIKNTLQLFKDLYFKYGITPKFGCPYNCFQVYMWPGREIFEVCITCNRGEEQKASVKLTNGGLRFDEL